jgi:hypothetical protein
MSKFANLFCTITDRRLLTRKPEVASGLSCNDTTILLVVFFAILLLETQVTTTATMKTEMAQQLRFPWKLHLLLERCASECSEDIISWLPDGKSFRVHDKERFVSEIMPAFFGTQNFKTFQRNLNLW